MSAKPGYFQIPTEAVGELCLCLTADDGKSIFSVGIVRAHDVNLRTSKNKDQKRRLNPDGVDAMHWLAEDRLFNENLLLNLDDQTRDAILDSSLSGQKRVNELFRRVQRRVVRREVVLTVAQQNDGPKRVRDARRHLQPEGILVLGHQGAHPAIALGLGIDVPPKGSWISVPVQLANHRSETAIEIEGTKWDVAPIGTVPGPGPIDYQ